MAGRSISPDRVLVADNDAHTVAAVGLQLRAAGFDVLEAFDGPSALDACLVHSPALALVSYEISGSTGVVIAHQIADRASVPVVLMSAECGEAVVREATAAGVMAFLLLPVDARQLVPVVRIALQRARDLHALRSRAEQLNTALQGGRNVSMAAGLLMAMFHIGREEAFERLRRHARSNRARLEEVASELLRATDDAAKLYESLSQQVSTGKPHTLCRTS
ncbi:MAG: ANTAR domain-containing response regulator [Steroidobacteraceae bacterium]